MASITIRKLDEKVKARLRVQAAEHGRSMEEEAREILQAGLVRPTHTGADWVKSIRAIVEPFGGFEFEIPPRKVEPPRFTFDPKAK